MTDETTGLLLRNESIWPDQDIADLVTFAANAINAAVVPNTAFHVHMPLERHRFAGRAYNRVGSAMARSPREYLVHVSVTGNMDLYPLDNLMMRSKLMPRGSSHHNMMAEVNRLTEKGVEVEARKEGYGSGLRWRLYMKHPYGGITSPLVVTHTWQEAIVAVAAHESNHILQFMTGTKPSEVACERAALRVVELFRETIDSPIMMYPRIPTDQERAGQLTLF
jgi:hypothetical protein